MNKAKLYRKNIFQMGAAWIGGWGQSMPELVAIN